MVVVLDTVEVVVTVTNWNRERERERDETQRKVNVLLDIIRAKLSDRLEGTTD